MVAVAAACGGSSAAGTGGGAASSGPCKPADSPVITLAAYSNPYDAYGKLTSTFAADWKDKHDQSLIFQMSFGGSTTQAQNIVNGFPADVYASSTATDVETVQDAKLITSDWQNAPDNSIVATSVVGFMVRREPEGDPQLERPHEARSRSSPRPGPERRREVEHRRGVRRGHARQVPGYKANDPADAERLLEGIFKNVTVLDKSERLVQELRVRERRCRHHVRKPGARGIAPAARISS
jgi:sulfate transport system substrate-binding protein